MAVRKIYIKSDMRELCGNYEKEINSLWRGIKYGLLIAIPFNFIFFFAIPSVIFGLKAVISFYKLAAVILSVIIALVALIYRPAG